MRFVERDRERLFRIDMLASKKARLVDCEMVFRIGQVDDELDRRIGQDGLQQL